VRGEILLKSNPADTGAAEVASTQAIEVARGQSARRYELYAAMRLARLWTSQGQHIDHTGLLTILAAVRAERSSSVGSGKWTAERASLRTRGAVVVSRDGRHGEVTRPTAAAGPGVATASPKSCRRLRRNRGADTELHGVARQSGEGFRSRSDAG
jgi:hypothetical protein